MKRHLPVLLCFLCITLTQETLMGGDDYERYLAWKERIERWREWYRSRGVAKENGDNVDRIENAAQQISTSIASESGGNQDQYIEYARRLALTLNEKSSEEIGRIITKGSLSIGN